MTKVIDRIDKHNSIVKEDGKVLYNIKGSDLNFYNGSEFVAVDCDFSPSDPGDKSDFKTKNSNWKTGYLKVNKNDKAKWPVGIKYNDVQLKLGLRQLAWFNKKTNAYQLIDKIDLSLLNSNGTMVNAMQDIDVQFTRKASEFKQTIILKSKDNLPKNPYGDDGELSYWTQFNYDEENLEVYTDESLWDGFLLTETKNIWFKKKNSPEVLLYLDPVSFPNNDPDGYEPDFFGFPQPLKPILEKKRLFNADGAYYIVESVPADFINNHDYSTPLELNYTTKTVATISSNETWTSGTYEVTGSQTVNNDAILTHDDAVIVKGTAGGGFPVFVLGDGSAKGILDINGLLLTRNYYVSEDDDTIGETLSGSDGIPTSIDITRWADIAHADSRITADYSTIRHGGATVNDWVINITANGAGCTLNNCIFEHNGSTLISDDGSTGTFVNGTDILIRSNNLGANGGIQVKTGQITDLVMIDNLWQDGAGPLYQVYFSGGTGSFLKNSEIHSTNAYICVRIDGDATAKVWNCTFTGGSRDTNASGIFCFSSTVSQKLNIMTGMQTGSYQVTGTINSDHNDCVYNDANYLNTSKGIGDEEIDPMFTSKPAYNPYTLDEDSPLIDVATAPLAGDAGYEYAPGKLKDDSGTIIEASTRLPYGRLQTATASVAEPAVDIDVVIKKAAVREVLFTTGDTVQVTGNLEGSVNTTGVAVSILVRNLSDDALVATLFSGTTNLTANTPKTFATIAGAALEWTSTVGERYIDVLVTGGTPAIGISVDDEVSFVVADPSTSEVGVIIDVLLVDDDSTPVVNFVQDETITVQANIELDQNTTDTVVKVFIKDHLTGFNIEELVNTTYSFTGGTPVTLATIAAGAVTWSTSNISTYRAQIEISGGTPTADDAISRIPFGVLTSGTPGASTGSDYLDTAVANNEDLFAAGGEDIVYHSNTLGSKTILALINRFASSNQTAEPGQKAVQTIDIVLQTTDVPLPVYGETCDIPPIAGGTKEKYMVKVFDPYAGGLWTVTLVRTDNVDNIPDNIQRRF